MKYLLDTDHFSILQRGSGRDYALLLARLAQHPLSDLAVSIVSFHEQAIGAHTYISRARSPADVVRGYALLDEIRFAFTTTPVIPFDDAAAARFSQLEAQSIRVATMDLRIASIALSRQLTLLTRNASDFAKVPQLKIKDWTR